MLQPEYFENKEDRLLEIYRQLEDFILNDISMRLLKAGEMSGTADRLIYKLKVMGESQQEIEQKLAKLTGLSRKELRKLLQDAVLTSWEDDAGTLRKLDVDVSNPLDNPAVIQVMDAEYKKSLGELENLTRSTMKKCQKDLLSMLDEAEIRVASGGQSYSSAVCDILDKYAGKGVEVEYPSGTKRTLEAAVRLCVVTSMNQTAAQVTNQYIVEAKSKYVLVSAHLGARTQPEGQPYLAGHANWQGHVYRIRGSEPEYPNLLEMTGYDIDENGNGKVHDPRGLHGYNCIHGHKPWDKRLRNPYLDENGNLKINSEENRKRYELQQKQRAYERAIRKTKRELLVKQKQIDSIAETDVKSILQEDYDKLAYKLREQNKKYDDFCKDNDLQKQYDRIKVSGFQKKQASKANGAATRYTNDKGKAETEQMDNISGSRDGIAHSANTGKEVFYNPKADYKIELPGYSGVVNESMSRAARELAKLGSKSRYEHGVFVNLENGEIGKYVTDELKDSVRPDYQYLLDNPKVKVAFLHNHNEDTELSFPDVGLLANDVEINVVAAVRNDGIITLVESNGEKTTAYLPLEYAAYANKIREQMMLQNGCISSRRLEIALRDKAINEFAKEGMKIYGSDT